VYLDNAATTQKPEAVIEAIGNYYRHDNANVHRGVHTLSDRATRHFEAARESVAAFLGGVPSHEVIWTAGTTAAINLVAHSWCGSRLAAGDRILVSYLEHHSNIVPWQLVAEARGAEVVPIPVTEDGEIDLAALAELLDERVRLVAINHVSNAVGTVNPVAEIVALARDAGAVTLVDGAQAVGHFPVDPRDLGCDFYVFSGHKLFGPTGIGVLWGREALLEAMPPFLGGGEMIERVSFAGTTFNELPFKFEAGTPNIAGAVGLAAAIDYLARYRPGGRGGARGAAPGYDRGRGGGDTGTPARRRAAAQRGHLQFRPRRLPPLGRGHAAGRAGHRRAHGAPLRAAADGAVRPAGHRACIVLDVQHGGGRGAPGRGHSARAVPVCAPLACCTPAR
jgi:selenocysteine lyase/cysteine desulfurase